jgi:hypothetical protein
VSWFSVTFVVEPWEDSDMMLASAEERV